MPVLTPRTGEVTGPSTEGYSRRSRPEVKEGLNLYWSGF